MSKRLTIPPNPVPIPDSIRMGAHGVVQDIDEAKKRLAAFRKNKKRATPMIVKQMKIPANQMLAMEMMAERFGVTDAAVTRKFVEDGIAKYGNDEEREEAGIVDRAASPFEEIQPNVSRETIYGPGGQVAPWYGAPTYIPVGATSGRLEPVPDGNMQNLLDTLPRPFSGMPLGFNNDTEGDGA